jgi:hypothetical protein
VQAKEDAARLAVADQNPFGDIKSSGLQLILVADCVVNVMSQVAEVLDVERVGRHRSAHSSRWMTVGWEELPVGKNWQFREGVSTGTIV